MLLKSKNAVITGCNRGIGKAILYDFVKNGADVFAVIRKENAEFRKYIFQLQEQYHVEIIVVCIDFSDEDQIKKGVKEILSYKKTIDILVNNVGVDFNENAFLMTKISKIKETFQINYFSHMYMTQLIAKNMMKSKSGSIIFISSAAASDGGANVQYVSSKAAIIGAGKRLAIEFGNFGIRVNVIAPGLTDTELIRGLSDEDKEKAFSMSIMHREGKTEEIADAVVFLASEMSSFITGQVIHVDGGIR